ncbi:Piso0_000567 [Millerozyma farinosa CBS 7064]|uniref:Phosphotransferase n=1 Tax=Pichia sorbitophila (strain ATCC MYA-4447 / BCRC 22081 / CBS 7064 / NBRC 10061 / NRRL Y-12695) TaxID=559304 RepID=G8YVS7_PICSO|nr:Piso0_000567 [Millerozyma farinosa CBS 7064]CCE73521.1 Piso0_000567 [Millerozyma farinosa CBS 7064]
MMYLGNNEYVKGVCVENTVDLIKEKEAKVLVTQVGAGSEPLSLGSESVLAPAGVQKDRSISIEQIIWGFEHGVVPAALTNHSDMMCEDFREALEKNSEMTMLPNEKICPTGDEHGEYLVIDVGGSTLRIAIVEIKPPGDSDENDDREKRINLVSERQWTVENSVKVMDLKFFRWIAKNAKETLAYREDFVSGKCKLKTGISWSFPLEMTSHSSGNILFAGKGYTISQEVYGKDLKYILESVFLESYGLQIDIKSIVNDSLATYAAGAFLDKNMKLAMVLGTGLNACCLIKTDSIHEKKRLDSDYVLLNSELSFFGRDLISLSNKFDTMIDSHFDYRNTKLPYKPHMELDTLTKEIFQPLELMTSGRYIVELVRSIIVDLIEGGNIFQKVHLGMSHVIYKRYDGLSGELVCSISESDDITFLRKRIVKYMGWNPNDIDDADIINLKLIVDCVIKRAAYLMAITIVAFIKLMHINNDGSKSDVFKVGFVGSVLAHFKKYRNTVLEFVNEDSLVKSLGLKVGFKSLVESSIIGTAISAAYFS